MVRPSCVTRYGIPLGPVATRRTWPSLYCKLKHQSQEVNWQDKNPLTTYAFECILPQNRSLLWPLSLLLRVDPGFSSTIPWLWYSPTVTKWRWEFRDLPAHLIHLYLGKLVSPPYNFVVCKFSSSFCDDGGIIKAESCFADWFAFHDLPTVTT